MLLCRNRACNACLRERRPASVSMENLRLGPFLATKLDGELDLGLTASVASRSMSVQLHLNAASTPASYGRIDKWDPREDSRRLAGEPGSGGWGHAQNMRAGGEGGILCQGPMDLENRCKISASGQPRRVACTASMYRNRCPSSSRFRRMVNGFHYCRDERSESKMFSGDGSLEPCWR